MSGDRPPAKGAPGTRWNDPKTPGLSLRFFDTKAVWYLFYRTKSGQQRNMKVGDASAFTLTLARERAAEIRVEVAKGNDPAGEFHALSKRPTMQDLRDYHIDRHVAVKNKPGAKLKAEQAWDFSVFPYIRPSKAVADVDESDIAAIHHAKRKAPVQANRIMAMLSKAFNLAEKEKWRPRGTNPVQVERFKEKKRRRYPIGDEPARLMMALDRAREDDPEFVGMIELVCLTGCRPGEIRTAKRSWIRNSGLHLPDSKTGEKNRSARVAGL